MFNIMVLIICERGGFYITDKDFTDFHRLFRMLTSGRSLYKSKGEPPVAQNELKGSRQNNK